VHHAITPLPFKPPRLIGLSEGLLASHYENNYGGALRRLNAIETRLKTLDWCRTPGFEINGLKREELIAANSVSLHEIYFDSLGGTDGLGSPTSDPDGPLAEAIVAAFGSFAAWSKAFIAMGKALAGGSGWVVMSWSLRQGRLFNHWAGEHSQMLAEAVPILALDMYEHAYHMDFGADASGYVDAYMQNIHWDRPAERFARAMGLSAKAGESKESKTLVSPEDLMAWLQRPDAPLLLDVCLTEDRPQRHDRLPGARFLLSEETPEWIDSLPDDRPLVAYCMPVSTIRSRSRPRTCQMLQRSRGSTWGSHTSVTSSSRRLRSNQRSATWSIADSSPSSARSHN